MAAGTTPNDLDEDGQPMRPRPPKTIRTAKPDEGEAKGEFWYFLRALALLVAGTALLGWLMS